MKCCKICNVELLVGDNWTQSMKNSSMHRCKSCHSNYTKPQAIKWMKDNPIKAEEWRIKIKGVYGIFFNGDCLYVGESKRVNHRWADHKSYTRNLNSKVAQSNPLYFKLSKYGVDNLEFRVLEETSNHKNREKHWIKTLNPKFN